MIREVIDMKKQNTDIPLAKCVSGLRRARVRALTERVESLNGINMGQGNNLLSTPPPLIEAAGKAMARGLNDYSIQEGLEELRIAVDKFVLRPRNVVLDTESELRITSGATGAFYSACRTLLEPGSEAIVFEPYYPYHLVCLAMTGCSLRFQRLSPPNWDLDLEALGGLVTSRTRAIVLCNPNNPTGRVYSLTELGELVDFCRERGLYLICDEVYDHLTYDGVEHTSSGAIPGFRDVGVVVSSFSKTYAITGWRVGYLFARAELVERITLVHDGLYVCAPKPLQAALVDCLPDHAAYSGELHDEFTWRRDLLMKTLSKAGFSPQRVQGTYYIMVGYSELYGDLPSTEACSRLLEEKGIATVPSSTFYHNGFDPHMLRFCFALPEEQVQRAAALLVD